MSVTTAPAKPWLPVRADIPCPDCAGTMTLQHKPEAWTGASPFVYRCTSAGCRGLLSAHPSGDPVGAAVPKAVRVARSHCHQVFDPLWQLAHQIYTVNDRGEQERKRAFAIIKRTARKRSYEFMADRLGITEPQAHIGVITEIETLRRFYRIAKATSATEIREWAKARKAATP